MDNLSHTLVGLAAGELVQRCLCAEPDPARQATRHRLLLTAGALASNFPDLDLVLTPLLPSPLGYLLHHRGHTHTLLYAIAQALLLIALLWACWPSARVLLRASPAARKGLAITVGAGLLLHLALDYLNSYGVHPFYPFDPRWLYGDMVFILEPVFWVACGVPLAMMVRRPLLRTALAGTLACALVFFTYRGFLHWSSLLALAGAGAVLGWLQLRDGAKGRRALAAAFLAGAAFVAVQGAASAHGKRIITAQLNRIDPASRVIDIAMTAYPANPLCWNFVSVERAQADDSYRLRRGRFSLAPAWMEIDRCPPGLATPQAERLREPVAGAQVALLWESEASLAALRARDAGSCQFSAWLRFARAPLLGPQAAADARFGTETGDSLATLPYARFAGQACSGTIPAWGKPRQDLLAP